MKPQFEDNWESRIFSALTLIILGIIFLLNTTGQLPWSIWLNFFKLWPLLVISIGVSIIFSGSKTLKFIGSAIGFLIFIFAIGWAIFNPISLKWNFFPFTNNNNQNLENTYLIKASEYTDSEVKNKSFQANMSLGTFTLSDTNSKDYLTVTSKYNLESQKPEITKKISGETLQMKFDNSQENSSMVNSNGPEYNVEFGRTDLSTDLNFNFGASSGKISLDNQKVNDFLANVGAGSLEISLTDKSIPDGNFQLKNGLGSIKLTLPSDVGLKINYKVGLGSITFNQKSISDGVGNSTYYSSNYNDAEKTLEINVEVGLGSIEITTN